MEGYGSSRGGHGWGSSSDDSNRGRANSGRGRHNLRASGPGRIGPNWRPANQRPYAPSTGNQYSSDANTGRVGPNWRPAPPSQVNQWTSRPNLRPAAPPEVNQWTSRPNLRPTSPSEVNQWNVGRGGPNWRPASPSGQNRASTGPFPGQSAAGPSSPGQKPVSGGSYADKIQSSSSHSPKSPGAIVPKMQSLGISGTTSQSSFGESILPIMKRSDNGGAVSIKKVNILVNHFPVSFNPDAVFRHYNIEIKPEVAPPEGRLVWISKADLTLIKDKLLSEDPSFQLDKTAYDGEKNIFSTVPLRDGQFSVTLSGCSYSVSVNLVNELKLRKLTDYFRGNLLQIPRDVLQGMDVVMKENPRRRMFCIGKSFHPMTPFRDFGNGLASLAVSRGFQQSLKPTSQGLALCLDYSVLAVTKQIPVTYFLREQFSWFSVKSFPNGQRKDIIENALKELKVTVTHRMTKQKYLVAGLSGKKASDIWFDLRDTDGQGGSKSVRLIDYFEDKYRLTIKFKDIPCLKLGRGKRENYVPIELCVLVEGQRFPKENLDKDSAKVLKNLSLVVPEKRRSTICEILQDDDGPCGGGICINFGMQVRTNMTKVQGRVIRPPILKLRSLDGKEYQSINPRNQTCDWNLTRNSVVEGKTLERWAVIDFSGSLNFESFTNNLIARCKKLGLKMSEPLRTERSSMQTLDDVDILTALMETVNNQARRGREKLQLILCVMGKRHEGYKLIKFISETKLGIITQCSLLKKNYEGEDQYLANLGMKINAKLGGSNVELNNRLPIFEDESHIMLIGADVNHPRPMDLSSPSIAAVVASMNYPAVNKYSPRVRSQEHCTERITNFGEICLELIENYEKLNGVKPAKILIFRDGVSEAQFVMVLNDELLDLKRVLEARKYFPTITIVVVRKRHHTRLFPDSPRDEAHPGRNIPPGTVVDQTIVHPFDFDFFLSSHHGGIGTSKPTYYNVLWDEHGFTSDKLQQLIYNLCFTFARCCKPVSLPPPVYYADLLAYRGRLYYDANRETSVPGSTSPLGTVSSSTSAKTVKSLPKLHADIENVMYFI